jgi:hypothetical protein
MFSSLSISDLVLKAPVACKQAHRLLLWLVLVVMFQLRNVDNASASEDVDFCFEMLHRHDPSGRASMPSFVNVRKLIENVLQSRVQRHWSFLYVTSGDENSFSFASHKRLQALLSALTDWSALCEGLQASS